MFKSGFIAVVGSPNAGKSSLINKIFDRKISIVSDKVQTTRDLIRGIYNDEEYQLVFIDTPGFHKPQNKLQGYMNNQIDMALMSVDLLIYVVDAKYGFGKKEQSNLKRIEKETNCPRICLLNKADLISPERAVELVDEANKTGLFNQVYVLSVKDGFNTKSFLKDISQYLTCEDKYFADDDLVDYTNEFYIKEIIREKINLNCFDEIPHSVAIKVDSIEEIDELLHIFVDIYVIRNSQKAILIGKNGQTIKKIGKSARLELKRHFNRPIYLDLRVKVKEKWDQNQNLLNDLGYEEI